MTKEGTQYAALPWKHDGTAQIMLVSSRETSRWVLPKGWPMKGRSPHGTAACEAMEEAGVVGLVDKDPAGTYRYVKRMKKRLRPCTVTVFPLQVARERRSWLERAERVRGWFPVEAAAAAVQEAELRDLILLFGKKLSEKV